MQHWNLSVPARSTVSRYVPPGETKVVWLESFKGALRRHPWNVGQIVEQRDDAAAEVGDTRKRVDFASHTNVHRRNSSYRGRMLTLCRKKFSGSYLVLISLSLGRFGP